MLKKSAPQKMKRLSTSQIILLILVIILCTITEFLYITNIKSLHEKKERSEAIKYAESVVSVIENTIKECVRPTQILEDIYADADDNFEVSFNRIAPHLISISDVIGGIYVAPKGIVSMKYPEYSKFVSIGSDTLENPLEGADAWKSVRTGMITISGPYTMENGKKAFVIRNPIYRDDIGFEAFTATIIDWNRFVNRIVNTVSDYNKKYEFSVWREGTLEFKSSENSELFCTTSREISRSIAIPVSVPNDVWRISVEPVNGWSGIKGIISEIIITIILMIFVVCVVIYRQLQSTKKLYLYEHDVLTGLYTRSAFYRHVAKLYKENPEESYDILVLDVEKFKVFNAIYGQKKCDEMLCYIADFLNGELEHGFAARYGGDQFVVIFPSKENKGQEYLEARTKQIISEGPIKEIEIKYGYYGQIDRCIPINMICDRALMAAKSILHKYGIIVANYEGPVSKRHIREQMLEANFHKALENGDFQVWYQPKFDAKTEKLIGAEALVRWISDNGTIVSPIDFIYIFEDDGLIVQLDEYVFRKVCTTIKEWMDNDIPVVPISINLSRKSLHYQGIVQRYKSIVEEIGIPIEYVPLELTESAAFTSSQIKELAEELKQSGFRIDMDDFGTGSSSLASLNILPFDVIKIDKSLIDFIGTPDGNELVKHTIELAHFKKMYVVAEGVEVKEQLEYLRSLSCDAIQGYYFNPPMSHEKCEEYLKQMKKDGRI